MRFLPVLSLLWLSAACATPAHLVVTASDTVATVPEAARALATADVVVLGETHRTPAVHTLHHELLAALHERRPNLVIAMEMFERDVQTALLQYLAGMIDEDTFLARSRPWPHYASDYRPVVEFAKEHGLLVLAANAPQELVRRVAKEGIQSVAGSPDIARETTAPEDEYWDDFVTVMTTDGGAHVDAGSLPNLYAAQCLRDDTMAETIVDHLRARRAVGDRPLCVLVCGHGHSDHGRGTVARIKSRLPELELRSVTTELVADIADRTYSVPPTIADYVVVAEGAPSQRPARAGAPRSKPVPEAPAPVATKPVASEPPAAARNPEGQRPALGLMPDYADAGGKGVLVESVREGGPAYTAGIEEGDYITAIAGVEVPDVQTYAEVLDEQIIGRTVTVRVRRGDAEVDLQVKIGSRQAR
ncbi:MAG: ChaN family lipoprotein [Planctomycetes bacterium]|nr:ChaN family lipoprotein [Planctomycetota bacterium]